MCSQIVDMTEGLTICEDQMTYKVFHRVVSATDLVEPARNCNMCGTLTAAQKDARDCTLHALQKLGKCLTIASEYKTSCFDASAIRPILSRHMVSKDSNSLCNGHCDLQSTKLSL